jgi:hypothetical protein
MEDVIFFMWAKHIIGDFEEAKTFLTQIDLSAAKGNFGVKKIEATLKTLRNCHLCVLLAYKSTV